MMLHRLSHLFSKHYRRVRHYCSSHPGVSAQTPQANANVVLSEPIRILLAKLLVEETLETVCLGLGVKINTKFNMENQTEDWEFTIDPSNEMDVVEIIDGACYVRFVATKIFVMMGLPDEPFQEIVDHNNMMRLAEGGHLREDGKWMKPEDHPDPKDLIKRLISVYSR